MKKSHVKFATELGYLSYSNLLDDLSSSLRYAKFKGYEPFISTDYHDEINLDEFLRIIFGEEDLYKYSILCNEEMYVERFSDLYISRDDVYFYVRNYLICISNIGVDYDDIIDSVRYCVDSFFSRQFRRVEFNIIDLLTFVDSLVDNDLFNC